MNLMRRPPHYSKSPCLRIFVDRGEIHFWHLDLRKKPPLTSKNLEHFTGLLSSDELKRLQALLPPLARENYLITRAFIRIVLSLYLSATSFQIQFSKNLWGRPEIIWPLNHPQIYFSLSHTQDLILCAISTQSDFGIDVEKLDPQSSILDAAEFVLSTREMQFLSEASPQEQRKLFYAFWTLKESYLKARGLGLSIPFKQISFTLDGLERAHVLFDPNLADLPTSWRFYLFKPTPTHQSALAIRTDHYSALKIINQTPRGMSIPDLLTLQQKERHHHPDF